eukprot:410294-Rhodomonas_salina.2
MAAVVVFSTSHTRVALSGDGVRPSRPSFIFEEQRPTVSCCISHLLAQTVFWTAFPVSRGRFSQWPSGAQN